MTCIIIGVLVTCLGTTPAPNPDKAFKTFVQSARPMVSVPVYPAPFRGPYPPNPRGASLGPFDFPPDRPRTRLDGSLLSDPVAIYGGYPGVSLNIYPSPGPFSLGNYVIPPPKGR